MTAIHEQVIAISNHAARQARTRAGWNKNAIFRMAKRALLKGIEPHQIRVGSLRRWLTHKYCDYRLRFPRFYGGFVFLFSRPSPGGDTILVTLYRVPRRIIKLLLSRVVNGEIEVTKRIAGKGAT